MPRTAAPPTNAPITVHFAGENFVVGGGVAIFHVASRRVVVCSALDRRGRRYYFLPKGRRDAGEGGRTGAEREGYEESGYRNRVLPLPTPNLQPQPHPRVDAPPLTAEPVWMQMMPLGYRGVQYVLYWYVAETLPPHLEAEMATEKGTVYKPPPAYPMDLTLRDRLKMEPQGYEPVKHQGTGVDAEELLYESELVGVEEAVGKLGRGGVMADVVLRGWKGIQDRFAMEEASGATTESPETMH